MAKLSNTIRIVSSRKPLSDMMEEFRAAALERRGIDIDTLICDTKDVQRVRTRDKPHSRNGRYCFHTDGIPSGWFQNMADGIGPENWSAKSAIDVSAEEWDFHKARVELRRQVQEATRLEYQAEAAEIARDLWAKASQDFDAHPYLEAKQISKCTARLFGENLVIPVYNENLDLVNTQSILSSGVKRFLKGALLKGCFSEIAYHDDATIVYVTEGFATGASVHEATDLPVVIALNDSNMPAVCAAIRKRLPSASIIVCGDDDASGRKYALEAASECGGKAIFPHFAEGRDDAWNDFNDLAVNYGHMAVRDQLSPGPKKKPLIAEFKKFDASTLPPRAWLYGTHHIRRFMSCTVSPGGRGKSSLVVAEALAMATGRNLLGEEPRKRLRVFYWGGEDPKEETLRKVAASAMHYGIDLSDLQGWLWVEGREFPIKIASRIKNSAVLDVAFVNDLVEFLTEYRIDATIFDPFVASHSVKENDTDEMQLVASAFSGIANDANCSVELVHHVRKANGSNDITEDDARGAGALMNAARAARMLNGMSSDDAAKAGVEEKDRRYYFRVDAGKPNLAPVYSARWRKLVNVNLGNGNDEYPDGDNVGVVTKWEFPDVDAPMSIGGVSARDVFLEILDRRNRFGKGVVNASPGTHYAPLAFEREEDTKGYKKKALEEAMNRLLEQGKIEIISYRNNSRDAKMLVVCE